VADEEHVALLKQGVDAWNAWRRRNPDVAPDLSGADLNQAFLDQAKLFLADLSRTDLSKASLNESDLSGAKLREAILWRVDLYLADLSGADLSGSAFDMAKLSEATLNNADLRATSLIDAVLDNADLTDAKLWSTQRDGWSIKGVKCEHAFWDRNGKEATHYDPGEFERLHSEGLSIQLRYEDGMSPIEVDTLPMLIRHLQSGHQGTVLRLRSIEHAPGGAKARIVIEDTGDEDPATLKDDLQREAETVQSTLRENLTAKEDQIKLLQHELSVLYEKVFPMLLESKSMSSDKRISIGSIEKVGSFGDISGQAQVTIDQSSHYSRNDLPKIKDLITDILAHKAELQPDLPSDRLDELEASLNTIQSQLSRKTPDTSLLHTSLATVKRILEGATANVVASGWLKLLGTLV